MSTIAIIADSTRLSRWILRLHTWLDRHPVTIDEAASIQEHTIDPPISPILAQALLDDSQYEMDWIRLATKLSCEREQRICLQNALRINAGSNLARRELARLSERLVF